jgi:hypothetical protein
MSTSSMRTALMRLDILGRTAFHNDVDAVRRVQTPSGSITFLRSRLRRNEVHAVRGGQVHGSAAEARVVNRAVHSSRSPPANSFRRRVRRMVMVHSRFPTYSRSPASTRPPHNRLGRLVSSRRRRRTSAISRLDQLANAKSLRRSRLDVTMNHPAPPRERHNQHQGSRLAVAVSGFDLSVATGQGHLTSVKISCSFVRKLLRGPIAPDAGVCFVKRLTAR